MSGVFKTMLEQTLVLLESFGELRELHKMKDDGVIDGQEFERLKGLLMSELE